jgi:hypothetical protein
MPAPPTERCKPLPWPIRNNPIIPGAEQAFPTPHCQGQNALKLVVLGFVRPVHQSRHEAEAAGVIDSRAHAALHKGARDGIHFHKAGIGESFLRGEPVCGERCGQRGEAEFVARVKETVCARRGFELDERGRWREQRVNRSEAVAGEKIAAERWCGGSGRYRQSASG